jgi:hypothetical protein
VNAAVEHASAAARWDQLREFDGRFCAGRDDGLRGGEALAPRRAPAALDGAFGSLTSSLQQTTSVPSESTALACPVDWSSRVISACDAANGVAPAASLDRTV